MSNFNQLKNMWENRATTTNAPPPIKPLPEKLKAPITIQQPSQKPPQTFIIKKPLSVQQSQPSVQVTIPRQSVADLKNNLQGKIKLGQNNLYSNSYQNSIGVVKPTEQQPKTEQNLQFLSPKEVQPIKSGQPMPTFHQSREMLEKLYSRRSEQSSKSQKNEAESPHTSTAQSSQVYIDLKQQQQDYQKLTPEQRTQQVIQRIFPESSSTIKFLPTLLEQNTSPQMNSKQTFLNKEEEATNLAIRNKKQKKSLGDFDDA